MGPERRRESGRETKRALKKKKKTGASEQQCQKRATVVLRACRRLARHQLARGRCNWERWVIIATNLPLNTCASPLEASQRLNVASLVFSVPPPPTPTDPNNSRARSGSRRRPPSSWASAPPRGRSATDALVAFPVILQDSEGPARLFNRCVCGCCTFQISLRDHGGPPPPI